MFLSFLRNAFRPVAGAQDLRSLDCRRVQALYRLAPGGAFVGAVVASIAIATLVPFTRGSLLLGWYLGVLLVVATVFVLVRAYRGAPDVDDHPLRWESRFALLAAVRGAAWGALSLVPDRATYLPQVFVLFVIGGVGIGSIGPLGASRRAYAAFAVPLLAIPALQLFAAGGPVYRPMGLLAIAFGAALAFVFLVHNRAVLAGIGGALRNGRLAAEQRALFENASVGIAMMKDDCIADCNRRFAELVGAPHESLLGQPVAALVGDQEGWREARSALAGIGAAVERLRDELPVRRQDGTLVWCDVSMSLLNAESPGQGIVGFFVDIGARKQADNELHRALAEQQAIFDASSAGIALVREMRLVKVNERMAELVGYTPAELAGLTMNTLFASENEWRRSLWQAEAELSHGRGFQQEVRLVRKNRSELWCLMQGRAIRTAYPREGLILTFSDVTERKSAEAQLRASEQRLELVVSAAQSGVWDWDIVAKTAYFSPRFKEILGYAGDADLRDLFTFSERLHPEDRDRVLAAQERAVLELAPFDEEYRLARADGTYVWLRGSGRGIAGPNGRAQRFVGAVHDISDRKRVEAQLRESEAHFRRLVETSNDLIWEIDAQRCWTYLSPRAARQLLGRESESLVGELFTSTQPESERDRTDSMLDRVLAGEMVSRFQTVHLDSLGERISLSYNATPVRDAAGNVRGASGTATDIGERLAREAQLAAALAEQELIFEAASEGIVFEKDGIVRKCNGMFASMLGHRPEDLVGQLTSIWFADPAEYERGALAAQRRIRSGQVYETELRVRRRSGDVLWCGVRGQGVRPGSLDEGTIWVYSDISERKASEERIRHLAHHDALTGLPNRRLLEDRLQRAIVQARRSQVHAAIMLIDLDGFKAVNDGWGHRTGDRVLSVVGHRLKRCVRETDTVARVGGDEFVVVLSEQQAPGDAATVAEKIIATISEPVVVGDARFEIGASIGISVYPRDGITSDDLLKHADMAMYRVKEAGKKRFQFYRAGAKAPASDADRGTNGSEP